MRTPRFIQNTQVDSSDERVAARAALQATPASASPKFFYDKLGSHLFEAITELPEYYPTRTEAAIFQSHAAEIAACVGSGITLVDLGAGSCAKATRLFPLLEPQRYIAIDISVDFLHDALRQVQREYPTIDMVGLGLDFSQRLDLPAELIENRPVYFYPGSSIGNFSRPEALTFLRRVREQADGGGLIIGVDLVKPVETLEAAYDDALGVTAAFNLNLLRHLNRLIDSDFDAADWRHVAFFNREASRIEMHLEATRDVAVHWPGGTRRFASGERIHTESSCKYTAEDFAALLGKAGFRQPTLWTDPKAWFAVFWAPAS